MLHDIFDGYQIAIKYLTIILKFTIGEMRVSDGVLYCARFKHTSDDDTANAVIEDDKSIVKAATPILKVNIKRIHDCLGHVSKTATRKIAAQLGLILSRTGFQTCEACAIGKAQQRNISKEATGDKATTFNGQVGHDLSKIKAPEGMTVQIHKSNWHVLVDEMSGFKRSAFFETKSCMIDYMCNLMHSEAEHGYPIRVLRQDNAGENVKLIKTAKGKDWKLTFDVEYTARKTPQQNSHVETSFTIIVAQARCMLIAGHVPSKEQFKLWPEAAKTATHLNNLMPVTIDGVTKTRWEWAEYEVPEQTKTLRTFGEADVVKEGKQGKVLDRGITMMFVGYSENHAEMVFRMYHPETSRIVQTRDVIWMGRMYHTRQNADLMQQLPIVTVPISIHEKSDDAEIQQLEVATICLSDKRGVLNDSSSVETNEWVPFKTRYGRTVGRKDGAYDPSSGTTIKWSDLVAAEVDVNANDITDINSN